MDYEKYERMSLEELETVQKKHREQMAENREKTRRRKSRTHKLIIMGAELAPHVPGFEELADDVLQSIVRDLLRP
ncbi:MAG: DUF3847 domain-containing protein [Oscillospiraceae bacterium]|nr:DUF3847 domain-containing protein [Oscillospiraceae bacterium]